MSDIQCISCGQKFEDYKALALHISSTKKGHRKGRKWAAKYISKHIINKRNNDYGGRSPLTDEDKANKEDTRRILSGSQRFVDTICPKCNKPSKAVLEEEYVISSQAWKMKGRLVKMCTVCGG